MMLQGKVAIVTGAGGGIGREIAVAMALAGAAVVVNDIGASLAGEGLSETPGEQTKQIIEQRGGRAVTSRDSVADWASAQKIVQAGWIRSAGSTSWSTTPASCATSSSIRWRRRIGWT